MKKSFHDAVIVPFVHYYNKRVHVPTEAAKCVQVWWYHIPWRCRRRVARRCGVGGPWLLPPFITGRWGTALPLPTRELPQPLFALLEGQQSPNLKPPSWLPH